MRARGRRANSAVPFHSFVSPAKRRRSRKLRILRRGAFERRRHHQSEFPSDRAELSVIAGHAAQPAARNGVVRGNSGSASIPKPVAGSHSRTLERASAAVDDTPSAQNDIVVGQACPLATNSKSLRNLVDQRLQRHAGVEQEPGRARKPPNRCWPWTGTTPFLSDHRVIRFFPSFPFPGVRKKYWPSHSKGWANREGAEQKTNWSGRVRSVGPICSNHRAH